MRCNNCGNEISMNSVYCSNCGTQVNNTQINDITNNEQIMNSYQDNLEKQGSTFGWAILGFFIPLVGIILFFIWKKNKPKASKSAGIGALISIIINVMISIIFAIVVGLGATNNIKNLFNNSNNKENVTDTKGYWSTSDEKMIFSIENENDSAEMYLTLFGGDIFNYATCEYTNDTITDSYGNKMKYSIDDNILTLTYDGEKYSFNKITKEKYDKIMEKLSDEFQGSLTIDSNDSNFEDDDDFEFSYSNTNTSQDYNDILGKWVSKDGTITMEFTYENDSYDVLASQKDGDNYYASVTIDSNTIDVYGHYKYTYKLNGNSLTLTNTTTNVTVTFIK